MEYILTDAEARNKLAIEFMQTYQEGFDCTDITLFGLLTGKITELPPERGEND